MPTIKNLFVTLALMTIALVVGIQPALTDRETPAPLPFSDQITARPTLEQFRPDGSVDALRRRGTAIRPENQRSNSPRW